MADLVFISIRRQPIPDAVAIQLMESNAVDVVKWCKGRIGWEEDQLVLHFPQQINPPEGHSIGYAPPNQWGVAKLGDWLVFDGDRYGIITEEELAFALAWKVDNAEQ